jgi:hypothetical protein
MSLREIKKGSGISGHLSFAERTDQKCARMRKFHITKVVLDEPIILALNFLRLETSSHLVRDSLGEGGGSRKLFKPTRDGDDDRQARPML